MLKKLSEPIPKYEDQTVSPAAVTRQTDDRSIEINNSRIRILQDTWQKRWNRLPSQTELQQLVDAWIHDEVLYRESLNRGLDRNDEIVRRRLIQKMQGLSFRLSWTEPPTPDEVAVYYAANSEQFQTPARRSFSQIYFSRAERGEQTESWRANELGAAAMRELGRAVVRLPVQK